MYCPFMDVNFSRLDEDHGNLLLDKGTNIMNVGKKGWIILDANSASTGYQWKLISDNSGTYKLVDNFYLPSYTGAVGTPEKSIWIIQAIRPGQGSILLVYKRSYSDEADGKQIIFKINIK
ncbi:protease inhibitor I42 family protein [Clostridium thailandense]|nr:protease inhibitor I42 family protein [Clostridium thailandense]